MIEPTRHYWRLATYRDFSEDVKFWWKYQKYPSVKITMQLDPSIFLHPEYDSGYGNMSIPISYSFLFQSYDDDSFNETLETISNFHHALIKVFLNHHLFEAGRMLFPLTRRDRFHVNLLTTFIYIIYHIQIIPYITKSWMSMNQNMDLYI